MRDGGASIRTRVQWRERHVANGSTMTYFPLWGTITPAHHSPVHKKLIAVSDSYHCSSGRAYLSWGVGKSCRKPLQRVAPVCIHIAVSRTSRSVNPPNHPACDQRPSRHETIVAGVPSRVTWSRLHAHRGACCEKENIYASPGRLTVASIASVEWAGCVSHRCQHTGVGHPIPARCSKRRYATAHGPNKCAGHCGN